MRGFGTAGLNGWRTDSRDVVKTLLTAFEYGYRHLDTSPVYGNEKSIGRAIEESDIDRRSFFIASKAAPENFGRDNALRGFDSTLEKLNLDYIDLYMLHWPIKNKNRETWRALEKLYEQRVVRSIGLSNFKSGDIEALLDCSDIAPMCNQIEIHPYCGRKKLRDYCAQHDIQVISWSPLGAAQWKKTPVQTPMNEPLIANLAAIHRVSPAQIILRWHYQHRLISIPKATSPTHIRQNFCIDTFELNHEQMNKIDALDRNTGFGAVPDWIDSGEED